MSPGIALQYVLPHRLLSRLALWLAQWRWRPWKNFFIGRIVAHFKPDMSEAVE
jgi:phosphatidylserine decarboxylase